MYWKIIFQYRYLRPLPCHCSLVTNWIVFNFGKWYKEAWCFNASWWIYIIVLCINTAPLSEISHFIILDWLGQIIWYPIETCSSQKTCHQVHWFTWWRLFQKVGKVVTENQKAVCKKVFPLVYFSQIFQ